jgi:transcriptional pleiotropic regulator of transition state genes
MQSFSMTRKVDALGRVVLPADLRRMLGIKEGELLAIHADEEQILLRRVSDVCVFCGRTDQLVEFRARKVCNPCVSDLRR